MRQQLERLAAETASQVSALNADLDAGSATEQGEHEVEQVFTAAAADLVAAKQELRQQLRLQCTQIIAEITQLQALMPDVAGPTLGEIEPPFRPLLQKLQSQTEQFRAIAEERITRRDVAVQLIRHVCAQLGTAAPDPRDSLAESDVRSIEDEASSYEQRLSERTRYVTETQQQIRDMCEFLSEDVPDVHAGPSNSDVARLDQVRASIQARFDERKSELAHLESQVAQVAELLEVPVGLAAQGNAAEQLKAADARLVELNELKRKCIGQVVQNARTKIAETWDELCVHSQQRVAVWAMNTAEASEAVLKALESERMRLQALRNDTERQQVVGLLHEYAELRSQETQLAEASRDPKRLAQRGFSQILKREEATRKLLERKKPPLVQRLLPLLQQWAAEHNGESFALAGEDVQELAEQERTKLERRGRLSLSRKRPISADAQNGPGSAGVAAKRVRPAVSTPAIRQTLNPRASVPHPRVLPHMNRGGERVPLPLRRPQTPRPAPPTASRPVPAPSRAPPQAREATSTTLNGSNASNSAVLRTAAIKAASKAIEESRNKQSHAPRPTQSRQPARQPPRQPPQQPPRQRPRQLPRQLPQQFPQQAPEQARGKKRFLSRPVSQPTSRPGTLSQVMPASSQPVGTSMYSSAISRSDNDSDRALPSARPTTHPGGQQQQYDLSKRPAIQSTPAVAQPQRQPLAPQRPSIANQANQKEKLVDWRTQRKADLQENGLSYYEDSTTDMSVAQIPAPNEESFTFRHFF